MCIRDRYTPAAVEVGSTVVLTWFVPDPDGSGSCTSSSDQVNITLNALVTANAGADIIVCGTTTIPLFANNAAGGNWIGGSGTFSPNRNTFNATYTPSASEIGSRVTLVWNVPDPDGNGPCTSASDALTITINTGLSANAGPDKFICGNGVVALEATAIAGGNWTGGLGTFTPGRNAYNCLLYTSDAADERSSVDLGGR